MYIQRYPWVRENYTINSRDKKRRTEAHFLFGTCGHIGLEPEIIYIISIANHIIHLLFVRHTYLISNAINESETIIE